MKRTKYKLGIVMDPISAINPKKDSSLAMLIEAAKRDYEIYYMEQKDLKLIDGCATAQATIIEIFDDQKKWYKSKSNVSIDLKELNIILMRKDPPFDMEYIYTTYVLDKAEEDGVLIVNKPQSLRDMNEKVYTAWFPECTPSTLISRSMAEIKFFLGQHKKIVVKPLDGMGGKSIFVVDENDGNANVIIETLTNYGKCSAMAQVFIPEIKDGDKRILIIDGKPVPYALARIPSKDDNRGNLVMGAVGEGRDLTERDKLICSKISETLKKKGILFCGIDVIGDYLTEINSTSPTGIRELDSIYNLSLIHI